MRCGTAGTTWLASAPRWAGDLSALYFATGSSGSGKTTLLERAQAGPLPGLRVFHVDALGAKSTGADWVRRAANPDGDTPALMVVDGQERPHLILDAARRAGLEHVQVLLVDCDHPQRQRRLVEDRKQPELDKADMYHWAAYLRGQADALGLEILDTTDKTVDDCVATLAASIERFARAAGVNIANLRAALTPTIKGSA